jgi:ankyrin repeat protein
MLLLDYRRPVTLPLPGTLPLSLPRPPCSLASIKNNKGSTALHFACYAEHRSEESLLLAKAILLAGGDGESERERDVDVTDSRGMTPLLVCCTTGRY